MDVFAGPPVPPGTSPGLDFGSDLAFAPPAGGLGTTVLGAALDLTIPSNTQPGSYSATLTITAVTAFP